MERREWRQLVQLSQRKPAFERRIGSTQRKQSIGALLSAKGYPAKTFTWAHFLFYVLFSFLLIPRLSLRVKRGFAGTFRVLPLQHAGITPGKTTSGSSWEP